MNAQLATKIPLEIKLKSFSFNKVGSFFGDLLGNKVTPVYKFYRDSMIFSKSLHPNACYSVTEKDKSQVFTLLENYTFGGPSIMNSYIDLNSHKEIILLMENYQNEKGEICTFDKGDAKHKVTNYTINIATLQHGVTQQPVTIKSDQNQYSATFTYCLGLPIPSSPICNSIGKYNDGTKPYILTTSLNLINKEGLQLEWQGSLDDKNWFALGEKTNKEEMTIVPEKDVMKSLLQKSSKCFLRYRIISPEITSEWAKKSFTIVPPAPLLKKENIFTSASCAATSTGKITVKLIEGQTNKYRIILFKEKEKIGTNCFEDTSRVCPESIKDTIVNTSSVELSNLTSGSYTLFTGNANIISDLYSSNNVSVAAFPKLEITTYSAIPANCSNPNGSINIETIGGSPDSLAFMITPSAGEVIRNGRKAIFGNLPEGKYNVLIKDACDQVVLTPPILIELKDDSLMAVIMSCKKPGFNKSDGSLTIQLKNGSGLYSYKLLLQDNLLASKDFSGKDLTLDNLFGGNYKIQITDKSAPKCSGWIKDFIIEQLPPSPASSIIVDTIKSLKAINEGYYIVVEKHKYEMSIYDAKDILIFTYPVVFGNEDMGDKMVDGDKKTPEGIFHITSKRAHPKWDSFFCLDYPTKESYEKFNKRKAQGQIPANATIGGEIGIHGTWLNEEYAVDQYQNWTQGCVSTKNVYIHELFNTIAVGTKVIIKK